MVSTDAVVKALVAVLEGDTDVMTYVQRVSEDDIEPATIRKIELRVATDGARRNVRAYMNSVYRYTVQVHVFLVHRVADKDTDVVQRRNALDSVEQAVNRSPTLGGLVNGVISVSQPNRIPIDESNDVLMDITVDYDVIERRT